MALAPGIHAAISADQYHSDPAEQPSLSASIATILCQRSPLHAWAAHPRLNPAHERTEEDKFSVGSAAHALLLEGDDICAIIDATDWRTKVAKEARDEARAAGRIPLLAHDHARVRRMVDRVREQLGELDIQPPPLTDGKPETTLVWEEGGVTCRARLDWLRDDLTACDDLKTTVNANPAEWSRRRLWDIGADIQAAMYRRGVLALTGADIAFRWVVCEVNPPHAVSVVSLAPDALALANEKLDHAIATWGRCLETGRWPGYVTDVAYAELPGWEEARWLEARAIEEAAA